MVSTNTTTTSTPPTSTSLVRSTTATTAKFTPPINHLHNLVELLLFLITPGMIMFSFVKAINDHHIIYFPRVIIKKNTMTVKEWLLFLLPLQHSPIHQLLILIPLFVITHASFPTNNLRLPYNLLLRRWKLNIVVKIQYRAVQILELDNWLIPKS